MTRLFATDFSRIERNSSISNARIRTIHTVWICVAVTIAVLASAIGYSEYQFHQRVAASNERLIEQREAFTSPVFKDRTIIRDVWENKHSVVGFRQSRVSKVSSKTAGAIRAKIDSQSDLPHWEFTPTNGYFADCFEPDDLQHVQSLLSSRGALSSPNGGGADYSGYSRWIFHFYLYDPKNALLYEATRTTTLPG